MIPPEHQTFIQLMAGGSNYKDAYLKAIKSEATNATACSQGIQLSVKYENQILTLKSGDKTIEELSEEYVEGATSSVRRIKAEHQKFIELVAEGLMYTDAYRDAVSNVANDKTCSKQGSRLAKKYEHEINELRARRRHVMNDVFDQKSAKQAELIAIGEDEVNDRLSRLIRGETGLNGRENGSATYGDILRGIGLYYRLIGRLYAGKNAESGNGKTETELIQPGLAKNEESKG